MHLPPPHLRRRVARLALFTSFVLALAAPVSAIAGTEGTRAEQRAAAAEERAAIRAQERARRVQEREARQTARREERAARRNARHASGSEEGAGAGKGATGEGGPEGGTGKGAPGAPAEGGSRAARHACKLTIASSTHRITVGETVSLSGKLICPSGTSVAGVPVAVYVHHHLAGLDALTTVTTESDGSFQLSPEPFETNSIFCVRAANARGARTSVMVAPRVTLAASSTSAQLSAASGHSLARARSKVTFTGTVTPADPGALVVLQVSHGPSAARWQSVAFGRVAADGSYAVTHGFRIAGAANVRTIVHGPAGNVAAVSEPLSYEIPAPQNPQLTIASSADPIAYGQSLTISGIAAGAPGQTVTLLAHTQGAATSAVATTTTDAGGHYSFEAQPLTSTYYRASTATTRSSALFEGVAVALQTEAVPSTVQAGAETTFAGSVDPARSGGPVYLEAEYASGTGFRVVGEGTVDAGSRFAIAHTFRTPGTVVVRIKVPGDGGRLAGTSAPFTITVTS
jgi:hypothetical protein